MMEKRKQFACLSFGDKGNEKHMKLFIILFELSKKNNIVNNNKISPIIWTKEIMATNSIKTFGPSKSQEELPVQSASKSLGNSFVADQGLE